ncbi:MAG: TraB/GumN family protein [Hydrogenophaga sp.]|nr:TraB/GumN family protein [Hydrogenophaga sp.]
MRFRAISIRFLISMALGVATLCATAAYAAAEADAASCPPQPTPPTAELMLKAQAQATDRGFLWQISRDGRDSFLYGTLHAGRPEWLALGPRTEASLYRTGVLALELNMTDPAVVQSMQGVMQGPARTVPAELMQSLRAAWAAECLPPDDLTEGALELRVAQIEAARAQRLGLFPMYGAEFVLLMRSLGRRQPVVGLESVETQMSAMLARSDEEAVDMVRDALAELQRPSAGATLERLTRDWERSDLQDLEAYGDWCDCRSTEGEREALSRLLDGRNPGMADAIERLHKDQSVFAAVGSLHMVGPKGLPALLKAKGFEVRRVF